MTVAELIKHLQNFPADSEIYLSNKQGLFERAKKPYQAHRDEESLTGDIMPSGSIVLCFENT